MSSVSIDDARWIQLDDIVDSRGRLTAAEMGKHVPFAIRRAFFVYEVSRGVARGGHAHRTTDQLAIAVHGEFEIGISDGAQTRGFAMGNPSMGLYIPRMIWTELRAFSPGAVCMVLASTNYDKSQSIRTWNEYLASMGFE